jgi:hypothetical protein
MPIVTMLAVESMSKSHQCEEKQMHRIFRIGAMLSILALPLSANAQKLAVTAVSHNTQEFDYNITTPQNSNTNCNATDTTVNCNTTTYGGQTQRKAVYRLTEIVTSNGVQYTLVRTARWAWSSLDWLTDGETFPAEIKGKHMYVTCHRGGNQGKKVTIKYDILDIRPVH